MQHRAEGKQAMQPQPADAWHVRLRLVPAHPGPNTKATMPRKPASPCRSPRCSNLKPCLDHPHVRPSRQDRGYDQGHDDLREQWRPRVEAGMVDCRAPLCLMPQRRIQLGEAWDLGHDDQRRHRGPEHARCNRSAGGKAAHGGQS